MLTRVRKNLGTFTTTYMDDAALEQFEAYLPINAVDWCTYPELQAMERSCTDFLLSLFGANEPFQYESFSTSGSSESIFLSLYFTKNYWLNQAADPNIQPNIVLSDQAHIAWKKAADCLGVDVQIISYDLTDIEKAIRQIVNKQTLAVVATMGNTTHLQFDPIVTINQALMRYHQEAQYFIPIHVDAASGGLVAPFIFPDIHWDFRLPHVKAINVSSHKFGGVYPSLGWLLIDNMMIHDGLGHEHVYLGQSMVRYPIQFSHSAGPIAAQKYLIEQLKFQGYKQRLEALMEMRQQVIQAIQHLPLTMYLPENKPTLPGLLIALPTTKQQTLQDFSLHLKSKGWHLPVYEIMPNQEQVGRIIFRYGFNKELMKTLIQDMESYFSQKKT